MAVSITKLVVQIVAATTEGVLRGSLRLATAHGLGRLPTQRVVRGVTPLASGTAIAKTMARRLAVTLVSVAVSGTLRRKTSAGGIGAFPVLAKGPRLEARAIISAERQILVSVASVTVLVSGQRVVVIPVVITVILNLASAEGCWARVRVIDTPGESALSTAVTAQLIVQVVAVVAPDKLSRLRVRVGVRVGFRARRWWVNRTSSSCRDDKVAVGVDGGRV